MKERLQLITPQHSYEREFMLMVDEFFALGEQHFIAEPVLLKEGFTAYLAWLERGERGDLKTDGLVPWSAFWAIEVSTGALVGVSSLRPALSPWMAEYGGHIGYRVRPARRRQGFGTELLSLTLREAARRSITNALVVCEPDNAGSIGVILKNGGVFEREVVIEGQRRRRYWASTGVAEK